MFCDVMVASCESGSWPNYKVSQKIIITILQGVIEKVLSISGSLSRSLSLLYFNTVIFSYEGILPIVFVKVIKLKTKQ